MSRTKIAPTLQEVADSFAVTVNRGEMYPADVTEAFRAELRALLAIARAGERVVKHVRYELGDGSWEWSDVRRGDPDGDLARALARLRRVSGGAVKGNRKLPANSRRASPGGAEGGGRP